MEITQMYKMLAKMTPQERLEYIANEQRKINKSIVADKDKELRDNITSRIGEIFQDKVDDYKDDYSDNYVDALLEDCKDIILEDEELWKAIRTYIRWII